MRTKEDIYKLLSQTVRGTEQWNKLIKELYENICDEADAEYEMLKAAGYSDDEIWEHADRHVFRWWRKIRDSAPF